MVEAVSEGRSNTAMKSYRLWLNEDEIGAVVDFVRSAFMERAEHNSAYHTVENGWPNHEQYSLAFPFALGQITLDRPPESLTEQQRRGRQLFMSSCITCHERAPLNQGRATTMRARSVSFPRGVYSHKESQSMPELDAVSGASPFAKHEIAPRVENLTGQEQQGEQLFQQNCAFCHGADGTGKNWIGSFLDSAPRDLTGKAMQSMTRSRLREVIRDGLPGTTMSAWKSVLSDEQIDALVAYIHRVFHLLRAEAE